MGAGKRSVWLRPVPMNTNHNMRVRHKALGAAIYQMPTPAIAMMKVGDSALWLKMMIQMRT